MLNLALGIEQDRTSELYLQLVEAGLTDIYCSFTGLCIGKLSNEEIFNFVNLHIALNPLMNNDEMFDHLALAMIPVSTRPSPLFQNMTPKQYHAIAQRFPEHMFRFLLGKLIFERWDHVNGHVNHGGKVEWLKSIVDVPVSMQEALDSLIRLDAAFSLRRCYVDADMKARLRTIRDEYPGFNVVVELIFDLESANITRIATQHIVNYEAIRGNQLAQHAAIQQAANWSNEELAAAIAKRKEAERTRQMEAENKSKSEILKINRKAAELNFFGTSEVRRGADAFMGLAMIKAESGGVIDGDYVLKALATHDFTKTQTKTLKRLSNGPVTIKTDSKSRTAKVKKAPSILIDIDLTL